MQTSVLIPFTFLLFYMKYSTIAFSSFSRNVDRQKFFFRCVMESTLRDIYLKNRMKKFLEHLVMLTKREPFMELSRTITQHIFVVM